MKASQHRKIEKTSLELSEKIPKLSESEKAFVEGILTGLQMNKAPAPAPAAKEPEKQEEVKQMPIEVEELVNKILKGLEESGKRYDLILPNLYTLEEPKK